MKSSFFYSLKCINCGRKTTEQKTTSLCLHCKSPLDVVYDLGYVRSRLNNYVLLKTPQRVVKYLNLLPLIDHKNIVTLEEGGTPLYLAKNLGQKLGLTNIFIKNEGLNPTGAFKDRGSFVEINKAKELGFKAVVVASTGNMAASVAAYSVQANLPCYIFVPDNTPRGKLAQCLSYGANLIQVRGTYADAFSIAAQTAKNYKFYLAGDYAFRLEGQKTLAYEVVEQTHLKKIDWVIVPIGMGTNIAGIWKGFKEYKKIGLVKHLPKLIGVQAEGSSPIVKAFKTNSNINIIKKPKTLSSAIAVGNPIDALKALRALRESNGLAVSVSDNDTLYAQQELARMEGIYVEPSSATVIAAAKALCKKNCFDKDDRIICVTTGAGLKDPATTLKLLSEPPVIEPQMTEVDRVIKGNLFDIRASGMVEKEKVLFLKPPTIKKLRNVVKKEFNLQLTNLDSDLVRNELKEFIDKGKKVNKADLQTIIEVSMQQKAKKKYLNVVDFTIEDTKHKPARAWVKVKLNGNVIESEAEGDGPVDAAINALRKSLKRGSIEFKLLDYNVEIATSGTNAAVVVTMILKDQNGNEVVSRQTSPDIILASLEAFENGYNGLAERKENRS